MGLNSYKGSIRLGAGLTPSGTGYPLMQACDIQVDEDGNTLADYIESGIADGEDGKDGADGVGISKIEKTNTNGNTDTYTITLTNGNSYNFTVTNGVDGKDGVDGTNGRDGTNGKDGEDGKTPQKGVDYFTPEEILSIADEAAEKVDLSGLMPTIRFANAQTTNGTWIIDRQNTLTFTVEITGGEVQEGDRLQICVRRKYKKGTRNIWRLRSMFGQLITAEDIGKRFLSIHITGGNVGLGAWLFQNDRIQTPAKTNTLSYIYFRIKRVTKYNDDGEECDAIFSNVEKVAKTFNLADRKLTIK